MQIVIDIPEEEVNECKRQVDMIKQEGFLIESLNTALKIHVANGTPLPKGHGRLIDADKTISNICGISCGCHLEECGYVVPCFSVRRIESAPTIIEADTSESEG